MASLLRATNKTGFSLGTFVKRGRSHTPSGSSHFLPPSGSPHFQKTPPSNSPHFLENENGGRARGVFPFIAASNP
jgi:hypothetical protein